MVSKYKRHTLYAKIGNLECKNYTITEALLDDRKRGLELMSGSLIEDLDRQTSFYASEDDLLNSYLIEVYGKNILLHDPVIIVDKDYDDKGKSYPIYDIVYEKEALELSKPSNIRILLIDYLKNNPFDIYKFRCLRDIFENVRKKYWYKSINELIDITVFVYFEDNNYKRYRESYFNLKKLSRSRVK